MLLFSRFSWWAGVMVGLALLLGVLGQLGVLSPFQGVFLTVTSPVTRSMEFVFRPVASFLANAGSITDLQEENRQLRVENEALQNRVTELQFNAQLVTELQQALGIAEANKEGTRLPASVVNRDSSPYSDVISIDRGTSDGVKVGMVVLSAQGSLVGTVTKTTSGQAFVRLITDSRSKVTAQVQDTRADGVVRGGVNRSLAFDLAQAEVKVGDMIVTSGLGGNYPPNVPIGRVTAVSGTSQDLFRKVTMEPLVRLSTVETVLVLTSFIPQRLELE